MYSQVEDAKRMLVYETALALYRVDYINKHQDEWNTLEENERMTNPLYIQGRFDALQGTARYAQFIEQAGAAINIIMEDAARVVESSAKPFPHPACAPPAFNPIPDSTGGYAVTTGLEPFPLVSWTGAHATDCPYSIASRLRALKTVL